MYARDRRFKTSDYKNWATEVLHRLREMYEYKQLMEIAQDHKDFGGYFKLKIVAYYPSHIFYNQQGSISSKTIDCTNFSKPFVDLLFRDTMDVNDKYIVELTEAKQTGARLGFLVAIELFTDKP